ncbi:MAG: hypothetical protein F7C35_04465 [Desulfurococcales archaeon]|nr:hypothetical protein [Desulfurococcales archaeon]
MHRVREEIEEIIIKTLRECSPCTSEEIMKRVTETYHSKGVDARLLRRILAELVKRGVVVRRVDYERRKILFSLPAS